MSQISRIRPEEVQQRLRAGEELHFLDVREQEEHDFASIVGCQLIPLGELASRWEEVPIVEGRTIVVYCHHGVRSITGVAILQAAGITNAASLSGGIDAWSVLVDPTVPRY